MSNPCPMGIVDFPMEILAKPNERTSPCPKGRGPRRRRRSRTRGGRFPQIGLETRKIFSRSDTRVESRAIDLSRARRRTHGTPRTTRQAHGAWALVAPVSCLPGGGLRSAPFFTPNLRSDAAGRPSSKRSPVRNSPYQ